MEEISITVSDILAVFGGISVIGGGAKIIIQALSPFKKMQERVTACETKLKEHDGFLTNDKRAIDDNHNLARENLRVNLALLNHFIDGNGVDKMKELREEIQDKMML